MLQWNDVIIICLIPLGVILPALIKRLFHITSEYTMLVILFLSVCLATALVYWFNVAVSVKPDGFFTILVRVFLLNFILVGFWAFRHYLTSPQAQTTRREGHREV